MIGLKKITKKLNDKKTPKRFNQKNNKIDFDFAKPSIKFIFLTL